MDSSDALSRSRYRDRRLNKYIGSLSLVLVDTDSQQQYLRHHFVVSFNDLK